MLPEVIALLNRANKIATGNFLRKIQIITLL